uniref:protein xylosyltransferase n=1 Tax=Anopheles stephensi TaxID=30069 RepID=A0A182Y7V1_ANOST
MITISNQCTTYSQMASIQTMAACLKRFPATKCAVQLIVLLSLVIVLFKSSPLLSWFASVDHATSSIESLTISNGTQYVLPCKISAPEAIDSITRVVTDECKIKLVNAACKNAQGKLTPRSIVNHCPRGGYVPYRLVGCFSYKHFNYSTIMRNTPENSPKSCVDFCTLRDFRYAITQSGPLCFCDDEKPNPALRLPDGMCNAPCPGSPTQYCGGKLEISVFETGLAKQPELPIKLYPRPQDKPVRVAFLLLFHKRNLRQIHRFLRAIYDKNHYYYIHVDPKQHYLYRELLKLEKQFPNIYVTRQRHTVVWGCFTQLQAMLASMKHILTIPTWEPDYILSMSGSDFPVKPIGKLTEFLTANRGRNFLQVQSVATVHTFISETAYDKNFVECEDRMWRIGDRQLPAGIMTNGASDWFCLTREFVQYALDERHDLVADLMIVMEHTIFATENFFPQVLLNSHFCQTHYNTGLRVVSWTRGHGCARDRSVEWTGCSPLTIRRDDWGRLERVIDEKIYAVRKFNPIFDQTIILTVEEYALGKYPANVPNLNAYWLNVYHHEDEKHDARMGAVLNVAHVLLYLNAQRGGYERYEVVKILEITHYFNRNAFEGFLVRHTALVNDHQLELELFVKPRNKFYPNRILLGRLSNVKLEVSNVMDQVERLPIDFDRILSVNVRPTLIFHLSPPSKSESVLQDTNHTVTVDWIDPRKRSEAVEQYTITKVQGKINHHSLRSDTLKPPLAEGVWSAKVHLNGSYVGMVQFLVVSEKLIELPRFTTSTTGTCDRPRGLFDAFENFSCRIPNSALVLQKHARFSAIVKDTFQLENTCLAAGEIAMEHSNFKQPLVRCSDVLGTMRKFPLRLLWRYKVFVLIGFMLVAAQIFLAYKLLCMPLSGNESSEERDLSRRLYEKYVKKSAPPGTDGGAHDANLSMGGEKGTAEGAGRAKDLTQQQHILRLDELDFVPPCELTRKETVSAIHRAKSQSCKAKIVEVACEILAGKFYPQRLPNYCPRGDHSPNRALGCFRDEKNFRLLSGYYSTFKTNNSPEKCIRLCLQSGYPFAGVQYGYECFCGDEVPKASAKLPDSSCNVKCPGDPKQACGGYFTINVYETGIRKFAAQSTETVPKHADETVRVAFLLTLNGRAVRQVHRLLKALYSPRHYYYIHIDARQEYLYRELLKLEPKFPNIRLARKRFSSIWGGASLLQMLLASMEHLLYETDWHWDFVLNLSESDFPLKTVDQLVTFLTANRGQNFVRNHGREVQRFIQKQGLDMTFVECDNRMWRIGDRTLPAGITIDGGSDWVCLSRDFARYVTGDGNGQQDELIRGLLRVFQYTILPAESFFHTGLRNSRFCHTYTNNNLHMTNWKRQLGCKCQYRHIVDWCGCSPNNFRTEDWERLQATQHKKLFFARKFEAMVNQAIVLQLEEWIFGPYPADYPNLHSYWQNVYHHEDTVPSVDGALLNVVHSLLRTNGRINTVQLYEPAGRVREITHYLERDTYRGFLVRHEATVPSQAHVRMELETWISPVVMAKVTRSTPLARRVIHLEVSTDYDEKEQLSRNFPRIIGTNAEPALIFRLAAPLESERVKGANATNHSLTVEWIDPVGTLVASSHFTIEDSPNGPPHSFNHFLKGSKLKQPLAEGVWGARLLQGKALLGATRFLVIAPTVPREASEQAQAGGDAHEPHTHRQVIPVMGRGSATANTATSRVRAKERNRTPEGHSGDRHTDTDSDDHPQQQLDKLVGQFFTIRETCVVTVDGGASRTVDGGQQFADCKTTSWSSLAMDPKSDIYVESVTSN